MLYTGWFEPLPGARCTQDAQLGRKGKVGKVRPIIGQFLLYFNDPYSPHPFWPPVLLSTGDLTSIATGAIFVIYQ